MTTNAVATTGATSAIQANGLNQQDFIKILLTQLTYQDPLKPMDNQQFMAQMAQFTALQQSVQLNDNMTQLIHNQAALQSVGLIGRSVDISTANGIVTGTVSGLALNENLPVMSLTLPGGGALSQISLGQIINVR
jgi:flagellar basal-body rod modification protein FlgD